MKTYCENAPLDNATTAYKLAKYRAKKKLGFAIHLTVYGLVTTSQMIEGLFSGHPFAFLNTSLGWGLGLLIHGFVVFAQVNKVNDFFLGQELERLGLTDKERLERDSD